MTFVTSTFTQPSPGFGLGLRTPHYVDLLSNTASDHKIDWLEIITDNFLGDGGKPLVMLDQFAEKYPLVMHGVAMSLGQANGLNHDYLLKIKNLANRINPLWISDHLCWTNHQNIHLHDLNPLPYTDEAAKIVIQNIGQAQDVLGRRLVVENVSSYVTFRSSAQEEWEFLSYVLQEADCLLLLDVNNVYVSSKNHGFKAMDYIRGLPQHRIQQIHLAGHSDNGSHIIDTHDHPVAQGVWGLYGEVCALLGPVATMIERDDNIPALGELLAELQTARAICSANTPLATKPDHASHTVLKNANNPLRTTVETGTNSKLTQLQHDWVDCMLDVDDRLSAHIAAPKAHTTDTAAQRLHIYHHAYRARLSEVLMQSFEKTTLYMGEALFDQQATAFAVTKPPLVNSLNSYGEAFPAWLAQAYPDNPELWQLAQLDWDLRSRFDGANAAALTAADAQMDAEQTWLKTHNILHPSLLTREISRNVIPIWHAIEADTEVPAPENVPVGYAIAVWRKALQPHFKTLDPQEYSFIQLLQSGHSILEAIEAMQDQLQDAGVLGTWFAQWLEDGFLRKL